MTRRTEAGEFVTGFCQDRPLAVQPDGRQWHEHCRGSILNGNGSVLLCRCTCHEVHTRCRDCGQVDVTIGDAGTCLDVEACRDLRASRLEASRSAYRLTPEQEARVAGRLRKDGHEVALRGGTQEGTPVASPRARAPRPAAEPRACHCGCGGLTKGGKFQPGHDASLKSYLFERARGIPVEHTPAAVAELVARGWKLAGIDQRVLEQARERVAATSPEAVIATSVQERYESKEQHRG